MQIFNLSYGHVTTFRHPSWHISAKFLVTDYESNKRHTFTVSAFHW